MNYPREIYDAWKLMTPEEYQEYLHGCEHGEHCEHSSETNCLKEDDDAECK
jgi:hypothetical protein